MKEKDRDNGLLFHFWVEFLDTLHIDYMLSNDNIVNVKCVKKFNLEEFVTAFTKAANVSTATNVWLKDEQYDPGEFFMKLIDLVFNENIKTVINVVERSYSQCEVCQG